MDDPYSRAFKNLKEQLPYWTTFWAGALFGIVMDIVREDHWPVILVWFFLTGFSGLILLGAWFITTRPENRFSVAIQANFSVWALLISYIGMSLISFPFIGVYKSIVQFGCAGVILFVGIVIYIVVKYRTSQKDKPL